MTSYLFNPPKESLCYLFKISAPYSSRSSCALAIKPPSLNSNSNNDQDSLSSKHVRLKRLRKIKMGDDREILHP